MARCPEAAYLDGLEGKLKWNYTTGLELKAFLDVYDTCGDPEIFEYVDAWYDAIIDSTGTIYKYKKSNYSLDHVCPGRTLFQLLDLTGKEKYRVAMDTLYSQLQSQPRTPEGGFWHKKIYPNQMWLDGLYMAQPFYAEYTTRYVTDSLQREQNFRDIVNQFSHGRTTGHLRPRDRPSPPRLGQLRTMFWCNPETGQSDHAWGRALGWYCMALVDVMPMLPDGAPTKMRSSASWNMYQVLPLSLPTRQPACGTRSWTAPMPKATTWRRHAAPCSSTRCSKAAAWASRTPGRTRVQAISPAGNLRHGRERPCESEPLLRGGRPGREGQPQRGLRLLHQRKDMLERPEGHRSPHLGGT